MPTDIEIARSVTPLPITEVAKNAGVDVKHLIPYGFDKAKVDYSLLNDHRSGRWPASSRYQERRGPARTFARPCLWR